ncbi:hypothetical protein BDY19DRAFT_982100 [Irpex rosettiformis]|uniref:Uncharacterized protein n=1 Tax=Irpex rosettiformis TaxID=378272 RepID=A0ACB8UK27_9APHY|nr:hypothetical protein BDY19DRAFT_982100 [Irpex rosettiformis]
MDAATPRLQGAFPIHAPRKKGPVPPPLIIDTPSRHEDVSVVLAGAHQSTSTVSSATSDTDSFIFPPPSRPQSRSMNRKRLSLTLPSAQSSATSLLSPTAPEQPKLLDDGPAPFPRRRPSVLSLPNASTSSLLHRKEEDGDGSPSVPYSDGPIQILPGIWLGNEDNARDWKGLIQRGIRTVLNVAKEVTTSFESTHSQSTRASMSTPDLNAATSDSTYFPAHVPSGRPGMYYLKLPWSHGQSDLVSQGFPAAMTFVDQALERGDGILIHCQCGVSRSATLVIALVMRAASQCSPSVPEEVWALKGSMQAAYSYVKERSKWAGPNMSLIYQLLDYERALKGETSSPTTSDRSSTGAEDEDEWARRRQLVEDTDTEDNDRESIEVMREAQALDKAMEYRRVARKNSTSSVASTTSTGLGMGHAWREKYARKRTGSIASTGSFLSENLVEEDEEQELLGVGGGFTETSCSSAEPTEDDSSSTSMFVDSDSPIVGNSLSDTPKARQLLRRMPPSAPAHKSSFELPPVPATAIRSCFDLTPKVKTKGKPRKRPPPLVNILPPVPSSPITPIQDTKPIPQRSRNEGRKPELPPAVLRSGVARTLKKSHRPMPISATPSQTLFVFPPSPTLAASRTPSTMTIMSNSSLPFPTSATPRVSTFNREGRRRSFIGVGAPVTPTIASSRVDARGWVGLNKRS